MIESKISYIKKSLNMSMHHWDVCEKTDDRPIFQSSHPPYMKNIIDVNGMRIHDSHEGSEIIVYFSKYRDIAIAEQWD